jgi:hypothetical protein
MAGWRWATVNEINSLFNSYGVDPQLGPGPDSVSDGSVDGSLWAPYFFEAGWRKTHSVNGELYDNTIAGYIWHTDNLICLIMRQQTAIPAKLLM